METPLNSSHMHMQIHLANRSVAFVSHDVSSFIYIAIPPIRFKPMYLNQFSADRNSEFKFVSSSVFEAGPHRLRLS